MDVLFIQTFLKWITNFKDHICPPFVMFPRGGKRQLIIILITGKVFARQVGTVANLPATEMEPFLKKGVLDWMR